MNHKKAIEIIIKNDGNEVERADLMIKEMCRLTTDLLEYKYATEHYEGGENSSVLRDKVNTIKKSMAVLMSEMEIYATQMDFTEEVKKKSENRTVRIAKRINYCDIIKE